MPYVSPRKVSPRQYQILLAAFAVRPPTEDDSVWNKAHTSAYHVAAALADIDARQAKKVYEEGVVARPKSHMGNLPAFPAIRDALKELAASGVVPEMPPPLETEGDREWAARERLRNGGATIGLRAGTVRPDGTLRTARAPRAREFPPGDWRGGGWQGGRLIKP